MPKDSTYKIYPIYMGEIYRHEKSCFTYMANQGTITTCPFIAFLLIGINGKKILVDTGASDAEWGCKYHAPVKVPEGHDLISQLHGRFGLVPEDIDYLIITHLHWDHAYNVHLFPGKKIYLQRKEMEYAQNPLPVHYRVYETEEMGIVANWKKVKDQFVLLDGDTQIDDGIRVVFLPGHTEGFQGVLVHTTDGDYLLASDCINLYENWTNYLVSGIHSDLKDCYKSYEKIKELERNNNIKIIPGHDTEVLKYEVYPV